MPHLEETDRRILDVGCGAGQTLIASAPVAEVLAVGVDSDHSALQLGTQLTNAVCFVTATGEALPFLKESFDLVISRVALPYMNVGIALNEMCRVLRPGGRLWLVLHPFDQTLKELISNLLRIELKAALYRVWVLSNGITLHFIERFTKSPRHFCYPNGVCNSGKDAWLRESDVASATTCQPGLATNDSNPYRLPRLVDTSTRQLIELEGWISGFSNFLPHKPVREDDLIPPFYY